MKTMTPFENSKHPSGYMRLLNYQQAPKKIRGIFLSKIGGKNALERRKFSLKLVIFRENCESLRFFPQNFLPEVAFFDG